MSAQCEVIVANFAWFDQRCNQPAVDTVEQDGEDWCICAEHLAAMSGGAA